MTNLASLSAEFLNTLSSKLSENRFSSRIISYLNNIQIDRYKNTPSSLDCLLTLCPREVTHRHLTEYLSICDFVVKIAFLSKESFSYSTFLLALGRSRELSALVQQLRCPSPLSQMPFPAILEESSTPFKNGNSRLWKEHLANEMFGDAHSQYAKIVDVVQLVCRDLEYRCMTVESPLREAEANNEKLQLTIEDISHSNSILKEECEELKREIEDKQSELATNAHEVRCAKMEIEGCQREWRNCMSAKETVLAESEKYKATWQEREKNLVETIGTQEEILKTMHEQLAEARSTVHPFPQVRLAVELTIRLASCTTNRLPSVLRSTWRPRILRPRKPVARRLLLIFAEKTKTRNHRYLVDIICRLIEISALRDSCRKSEELVDQLRGNIQSIEARGRKTLEAAIEEAEIRVTWVILLSLISSWARFEKSMTRK